MTTRTTIGLKPALKRTVTQNIRYQEAAHAAAPTGPTQEEIDAYYDAEVRRSKLRRFHATTVKFFLIWLLGTWGVGVLGGIPQARETTIGELQAQERLSLARANLANHRGAAQCRKTDLDADCNSLALNTAKAYIELHPERYGGTSPEAHLNITFWFFRVGGGTMPVLFNRHEKRFVVGVFPSTEVSPEEAKDNFALLARSIREDEKDAATTQFTLNMLFYKTQFGKVTRNYWIPVRVVSPYGETTEQIFLFDIIHFLSLLIFGPLVTWTGLIFVEIFRRGTLQIIYFFISGNFFWEGAFLHGFFDYVNLPLLVFMIKTLKDYEKSTYRILGIWICDVRKSRLYGIFGLFGMGYLAYFTWRNLNSFTFKISLVALQKFLANGSNPANVPVDGGTFSLISDYFNMALAASNNSGITFAGICTTLNLALDYFPSFKGGGGTWLYINYRIKVLDIITTITSVSSAIALSGYFWSLMSS